MHMLGLGRSQQGYVKLSGQGSGLDIRRSDFFILAFMIAKRTRHLGFTLLLILFASVLPAAAYYFQGYYCPTVLISPMRDNIIYTPAGMGIVTSKAGFRIHPVTGKGDFHSGVDLGANLNDKVYCLLDGVVTRVGWRGNLGVAVEIYHPYPNVRTICGHLNAYSVMPGEFVPRGRVIGYAGSTGRSTGVHVHYTVIKQDTNEYVEPMAFLMNVPLYVSQLRTARVRAAVAMNLQKAKENMTAEKATDSESDELPAKTTEAKPPEVDKDVH
jgi:murein DD-endopeptidase MepM/ murein hydrolase activator NlpD